MGIVDLFSDGNEKQAANVVDKGYQKGFKDAKKNLNRGFQGLQKDYGKALDTIGTGAETATGYLQPYADAAAPAAGMYSDALGLNGAGGNARAVGAFQVGPGYQFAMNQGLDSLDRRAASRGMLASGNNSIDTINYSQGLANQEYGGWLDRLNGQQQFGAGVAGQMGGIATNAATQQAAVRTGLGDVKMGLGERKADLAYATRLGRAGVQGDYLAGKDGSAMNAIGAITGGASVGARLLGAA